MDKATDSLKKPKLSEIRVWYKPPDIQLPEHRARLAREGIPYLLDLVKRMGKALGRFSSEFPVPGCGYCTITIEPDGKVTHEASCPIPEARELLKEIKK